MDIPIIFGQILASFGSLCFETEGVLYIYNETFKREDKSRIWEELRKKNEAVIERESEGIL